MSLDLAEIGEKYTNAVVTLWENYISKEILVYKLKFKMLPFYSIAGFFDNQYLWKESPKFLEFFNQRSKQGQGELDITT